MINVEQTSSKLEQLQDPELQQYAQINKADPIKVSMALYESNKRKKTRAAALAQQGMAAQPKVVDQTIAGMAEGQAQAMPEDQGIARLRTPNMETMAAAEGGIVGYADGGMVAFAKGGQSADPLAQYEEQIRREAIRQGVDPDMAMRLFRAESGGQADVVSPKGATGLGQLMIPAAKEMGLKPEERTDPAKNIPASIGYFKKQLTTFKDPQVALAAYNHGPGNVKEHLAKNEGQLNMNPASKSPEGKQLGLPKETADYINKILPVGTAYAAPSAVTADDAAIADTISRIPGPSVQAPAYRPIAPSFMGRQADKLGLSEDTQRNISRLSTAAGGAMGAAYIPSYLPKVPGGLAVLGERINNIISPSKQMTAAEIEALRVANQGSRVAEAAQSAELAGALPGEARTAAQAVEAANAAKLAALPSKAELVQDAAALRQAEEANRLAATARAAQYGGQAAAGAAEVAGAPDAGAAGGIPDLGMAAQEDFRRSELEAQKAPIAPEMAAGVPAAPAGEKPSWLTQDRAMMLGLNLLSQQGKPGTGSAMRDLLSGLGTAGINTLTSEKAEALQKAHEKYYTGAGKKAEAEAASYASGDRMLPQAMKVGNDAYDDWFKSLSDIQKMELKPGQAEAKRQEFLQSAMSKFRIAGSAVDTGGLKMLGSRPSA